MKPQYIIDDSGKKVSVVLSMDDFEKILSELDDSYCSKLYADAQQLNEPTITLDDYIKSRKKG